MRSTLEGSAQSACIRRRLSVYRVIAIRPIPIGISMTDRTVNETVRTLVKQQASQKEPQSCETVPAEHWDRTSPSQQQFPRFGNDDDDSVIILPCQETSDLFPVPLKVELSASIQCES